MRIAITGAGGLLGYGLVEVLTPRHVVFPLNHAECDITNPEAVRAVLKTIQPDAVIHTAAIPDPDMCEMDPTRAQLVNVEGTRNVVNAAREVHAAVAHISTDSVFDGAKRAPYVESDPTHGLSVYARTKEAGEKIVRNDPQHWIFRIPILFGPGKINFIEKGLLRIAKGEEYVVASDQLGCAACTLDVARTMLEVIEANRYGTFHVSNKGSCNRLELARRAALLASLDPAKVVGKPLNKMNRPAKRLEYSVMEMQALKQGGFVLPRPWEEALAEYIRDRRAGN